MTTLVDSIRVENHLGLRFRAAVEESAAGATTRPLHIGILCDNSGSMRGERMEAVKRTLHAARPLFQASDTLTLVTFSETARIVLQAHSMATDDGVAAAYTAIDAIQTSGSTNLSAGIETLYSIATNYDAVILLTDGIVNAGITHSAGLMTMAQAGSTGRTRVFHALGYGSDHNRTLLRDLAVKSRGTYTYIDSEEILPVAIGDVLSGLRAEVVRGLRVRLPAETGWCCMEAGAVGDREYYVGNMVPDRDYWAVFRWEGVADDAERIREFQVTVENTGSAGREETVNIATELSAQQLTEQVLRARVARALEAMSSQMEARGVPDLTELRALRAEIAALPEEQRVRGLMLRLQAQVVEAIELAANLEAIGMPDAAPALRGAGAGAGVGAPPLFEHTRTHLMARLSSGAACLTNQRGVYSMAPAHTTDPATTMPSRAPALMESVSVFSSPSQRMASTTVRDTAMRSTADMDTID
jgi:hypothetical protein